MNKIIRVSVFSTLLLLSTAPAMAIDGPPENAGVDWRGADNSSALHWAVYDVDVDRVKALIRAGADVNHANKYGANAMQLAAEVANTEILELLLKAGADVDSANPEGQTALMLVARTGNVDAAKLLVKNGANVNALETWGEQSALMWAAARRHPAMMDFLLDSGADINAQSINRDYKRHLTKEGRAKSMDSGGLTSLLFAVRENCLACVNVLIEHKVDLDLPDPDGTSPLMLAIFSNNWDVAKALIDAGASVNQWDNFGQSPLHAVIPRLSGQDTGGFGGFGGGGSSVNPLDPLNEYDGMDILRLMLDNGANPNMQSFMAPAKQRGGMSRGTTPLIMAAATGDLEVIKLLLEHGARADIAQADLQNVVTAIAGARGNPDSLVEGLKLLVAAGADINTRAVPHHLQRNRGGTPLIYAVRANNTAVVEALVALGADINGKDVDGLTALDYAMQRGHLGFQQIRRPASTQMADTLRALGATEELDVTPYWTNVGPPFYYPWSVWPLDAADEAAKLVPGSFDHQ